MKRKFGGGVIRDIGRDVGIGFFLCKDCDKSDIIVNVVVKKIYFFVIKMFSIKLEWKID